MQKLERGYERLKEKARNLVPIHADSLEELVRLAGRERATTLEVTSFIHTVNHAIGAGEWGVFSIAVSSFPDAYLSKTRYEARGLGRRIVMEEEHPQLDSTAGERERTLAQWRCELTAENRRELLADLLPKVAVSSKSAI